jgi:hypothetical protein
MPVPTRARRPGRRPVARPVAGASRLGRYADWRYGGWGGGACGGHGQHSALATLDRTWDRTWDQQEIGAEISDAPKATALHENAPPALSVDVNCPPGVATLTAVTRLALWGEQLFPRWSGCTDHAVSATAPTAVLGRHSGPRWDRMPSWGGQLASPAVEGRRMGRPRSALDCPVGPGPECGPRSGPRRGPRRAARNLQVQGLVPGAVQGLVPGRQRRVAR